MRRVMVATGIIVLRDVAVYEVIFMQAFNWMAPPSHGYFTPLS